MKSNVIKEFRSFFSRWGYAILWGVVFSLIIVLLSVYVSFQKEKADWTNAKVILISKQDYTLRVIDFKGQELLNVPCAIGKNPGNKKEKGDMKTPEGVFYLQDKQDSHTWKHDFGDGKGKIDGAYGPRFLRLNVPGQSGIGIHGTHLPESLGTRATEGCIRLDNTDILRLDELVSIPCVVIITPGEDDVLANQEQKNKEL